MAPGVYSFLPRDKGHGVTTFGVTLPFCPWELNENWLNLCLRYHFCSDLIDNETTSFSLLLIIRFYNEISSAMRM